MGNVAGLEGLVGSGSGGGSSGFGDTGEDAAHSHSYGIYGNNFALAAALAAGIGGAAAINPMVSRRGFLKGFGAAGASILAGCAPYVNAQSNQWRVLDESDKDRSGQGYILNDIRNHMRFAPYERAGIDFQFDGMHNVEVMSPTWAHVVYAQIDGKANGVFLETPRGHLLSMWGLNEIYVQPDDWITPATIIGTEGNKTRHAQGLTTQLHTHLDEPLHGGIFGKGVQRYTEKASGYEKEVRNPHKDSIKGRVEDSIYDGRVLTLQDIIQDEEANLDNLGRKYSGEHVGQLLNLSKDMGLRFFARMMVLYQTQKYGLIANPDFQRDAAELLADYRKNSKAMIFLIYRNRELKDKDGKEVYHKPEGPIDRMERVAGLKLELDKASESKNAASRTNQWVDGRNYREVIDAGQRLLRASPVWQEFAAYWALSIAYTWRDKKIALVYALAAIGMAEQKWGRPLDEKPDFYKTIRTVIANSYGKMGMQIEKTSFENSFKPPT